MCSIRSTYPLFVVVIFMLFGCLRPTYLHILGLGPETNQPSLTQYTSLDFRMLV